MEGKRVLLMPNVASTETGSDGRHASFSQADFWESQRGLTSPPTPSRWSADWQLQQNADLRLHRPRVGGALIGNYSKTRTYASTDPVSVER
jgi:hypothetical protein